MTKKEIKLLQDLFLQLSDTSEYALDLAQDLKFIFQMKERAKNPEVNFVQERHVKSAYDLTNRVADITGRIAQILSENGIDTWHLSCQHSNMTVSIIGGDGVQTIHGKLGKET